MRSRDRIRLLMIIKSIQNQLLITNTPHYNWSPEANQVSILYTRLCSLCTNSTTITYEMGYVHSIPSLRGRQENERLATQENASSLLNLDP